MTSYVAPGQEPRPRRYRQGDTRMGKLNAIYDRWRGPVTFLVPLIGGLLVSIGYQFISPSQRLDAQTKTIEIIAQRMDRQDAKIAQTDSNVTAINEKLDLLVDLACNKLTKDQRVVAQRRFSCVQ